MEFFTEEDYTYLEKTITEPVSFKQRSDIWNRAFSLYNLNHKVMIHMQCTVCYYKVMRYIKLRLEGEV